VSTGLVVTFSRIPAPLGRAGRVRSTGKPVWSLQDRDEDG